MNASPAVNEIAAALAKAQQEFRPVVKDKTAKVQTRSGASYSFDYADLGTVLDAVLPALNKNGIALLQAASIKDGAVVVETTLLHNSGQYVTSDLAVHPEDMAPQKVGSAITYARRYALSAMVGVFSEADDDANHASGNDASVGPKKGAAAAAKVAAAKVAGTKEKLSAVARTEAIKAVALKRFGSHVSAKAQIEQVIGRKFGDKPIADLTERELGLLEGWVELGKAIETKEAQQ